MKLTLLGLVLISTSALASNISQVSPDTKVKLKNFGNNFNFYYGLQYIGPSLDTSAQEGATYNRFKTGQDYKNDNISGIASTQLYHTTKLGYYINPTYSVSYTYTFQEELNDEIEYEGKDFSGNTQTYLRYKGISDNNKRINLQVNNIINNKTFYFGSTFFYELPSTVGSERNDMYYGVGIAPSVGFYSDVAGLSYGFSGEIQRDFYKKQEYFAYETDVYPTRYQTLKVNFNPYLNYQLNDVVTLKSSLNFDWDKKGDEINDIKKFNANMDDVVNVGASYNIDFGVNAGTSLQASITDPRIENTTILLDLGITVY